MAKKSHDRTLDEQLYALITKGNHDALNKLQKRYHKHTLHLVNQLLTKYPFTGISKRELTEVCDDHFPFVIARYNSLLHSSLLTYWKESTLNVAMNYLVDNSYNAGATTFRGVISFDSSNPHSISFGELIAEKDEKKDIKRKVFEVRSIVYKYKVFLTNQEFSLLNLLLDGYSLNELEHGGLLSKSTLYLTFKTAVKKLKKRVEIDKENSK